MVTFIFLFFFKEKQETALQCKIVNWKKNHWPEVFSTTWARETFVWASSPLRSLNQYPSGLSLFLVPVEKLTVLFLLHLMVLLSFTQCTYNSIG